MGRGLRQMAGRPVLLADRSTRDAAVTALRRAHELAVDLQAAPLLADIEALARSAAVTLDTAAGLPSDRPRHSRTVSPPGNARYWRTSSPGAPTARSPAKW